jgi:hypothetical protein
MMNVEEAKLLLANLKTKGTCFVVIGCTEDQKSRIFTDWDGFTHMASKKGCDNNWYTCGRSFNSETADCILQQAEKQSGEYICEYAGSKRIKVPIREYHKAVENKDEKKDDESKVETEFIMCEVAISDENTSRTRIEIWIIPKDHPFTTWNALVNGSRYIIYYPFDKDCFDVSCPDI